MLNVKEHCIVLFYLLVSLCADLKPDLNLIWIVTSIREELTLGNKIQDLSHVVAAAFSHHLLLCCSCGSLSKVPWVPFSHGLICWEKPERWLNMIMLEYINKFVLSWLSLLKLKFMHTFLKTSKSKSLSHIECFPFYLEM